MRTADQHGALPPVLAEAAVSSGGYRLRWAAEWVRERSWVVPAVLLAVGTGLAVLVAAGPGVPRSWGGFPADASWSSGFLENIAAQALSPAVNQPTTAVPVIDSLEDVLLQIARSPRQSGCYTDREGTVRLVKPLPGWDDCLDLAFTEVTAYGAASPPVSRRLRADPTGLG